jgi:glycosyltransferase involved in cell wall biosynthesis
MTGAVRKVAFLMTHPTQYHSPWFRALARRPEISMHVYYCFRLSQAIQGTGFGVDFEWDVPLLEGYSNSFLDNLSKSPGWHFSGSNTPQLGGLIRSHAYDAWVINGWTTRSEWQAIRACWATKTPMLIRGDSSLLNQRRLHVRAAKRLILGTWIPRFAKYLTVGRLNEEYYRHYGADPSRFVPVRHFVDNDWFAEKSNLSPEEISAVRKAWGVADGARVFLFAGKLIPKKQPLDALEALRTIVQEGGNAHLVMAGDGPMRAELEAYTLKHKLPVTLLGFRNQSEMPEAYASSDVLVLPSVSDETWGLVVNEAMACSKPAIVSTMVGCAPDLIEEGVTGSIHEAGNLASLASAMRAYVNDAHLAPRQGKAAKAHIANYSLAAATENSIKAIMALP